MKKRRTAFNRFGTTERLIDQIRSRSLDVAVVGLGYVGLPTAALFADAGFRVIGLDVNRHITENLSRGILNNKEPGLCQLVQRNVHAGRLTVTSDYAKALEKAGATLICVQTPIDDCKKPDLTFLDSALDAVGKLLRKRSIVIIGSTIPPGTMLNIVKPKLESLSNMKAEEGFYLACAPERIAPGKALEEFVGSPKIVGGVGPNSARISAELYRAICKLVVETDASTAEVAKLAENTFRDVNIAFANALALICEQLGVDVVDVIKIANTHPRVNIHTPGPGVGGPCLSKDPYLLINSVEQPDRKLVEIARNINNSMPEHLVGMILKAMQDSNKDIQESKITILGTAFKANVDDSRFSPAGPIIKQLLKSGAKVIVYDPYCKESFGANKKDALAEAVKGADCLVIVTDHSEFKNIDLHELRKIMNRNPAVVDGRRIINSQIANDAGFKYYGLGARAAETGTINGRSLKGVQE